MKHSVLQRGIAAVALLSALAFIGCPKEAEDDPPPPPPTYTVSFDKGEGTGTPPADKPAASGTPITLPGAGDLTAPAGKTFNGWKTGGNTYSAGDSYTVTGNVTFIAQWKSATDDPVVPKSPVVGVWIDHEKKLHYKFNDDYTYATAAGGTFTSNGTYEVTTAAPKRVTLRPSGGTPVVFQYDLQKSVLTLEDATTICNYTKNPESAGGFNGTQTGTLAGMWQNTGNTAMYFALNGDGEWFKPGPNNSSGKIWWIVAGSYEHKTDELSLINAEDIADVTIYTIELLLNGRQIKLKRGADEVTYEKRDNI
ncbi:MAG: InlB B-repeat-containing protein [Treponema sp.]|jgi:hypothetical protein|nr:InlB B-repeat-containing protein [Treponema sp.]